MLLPSSSSLGHHCLEAGRLGPLSRELRTKPLPAMRVPVGTPEHHRVYISSTPSTILSGRKKLCPLNAWLGEIAQSAEQGAHKPWLVGSSSSLTSHHQRAPVNGAFRF